MSSPSPQVSTSSLLARQHQTLLGRIVTHFIDAKQSLASTEQVYRANDIVTSARSSIEAIAITTAGNDYLLRCAQKQIRVAERIRDAVERVSAKGDGEFKSVLLDLDAVDDRTKKTMDLLKSTEVDLSFQRTISAAQLPPDALVLDSSARKSDAKSSRCLYDFVSERGVDELTKFFRDRIDETNAASSDFVDVLSGFDSRLQLVKKAAQVQFNGEDVKVNNGRTASAFHAIEAHAEDTAEALQSLVRHYDRCVEALKQTEGGKEAAAANTIVKTDNAGTDASTAQDDLKLYGSSPSKSLSDGELAEMLQVLEQDALEVPDVLAEIGDHLREMELQADQIEDHVSALQSQNNSLKEAVELLEGLGQQLPSYVRAGSEYLAAWAIQRKQIEDKMKELDGAREFYERFIRAYDGTVLEIHRRRHIKTKMEGVVAEAMARVDKLYEEDLEQRHAYLEEHSDYIPSDLWAGVAHEPAKFDITRRDKEDHLPAVSKEAVQAAIQRLKSTNL